MFEFIVDRLITEIRKGIQEPFSDHNRHFLSVNESTHRYLIERIKNETDPVLKEQLQNYFKEIL